MKKLCVIGLGYSGLPTAALLSNRGYDVHGVDTVQSTVDIINRGEIHIVEPELDTFVRAAVNSGKLKAALTPMEADINDFRESPALYITRRLIANELEVLVVEPNISNHEEFEVLDYTEALEQADVVTFLVAHKQFKGLEMKTKLNFCGVLN